MFFSIITLFFRQVFVFFFISFLRVLQSNCYGSETSSAIGETIESKTQAHSRFYFEIYFRVSFLARTMSGLKLPMQKSSCAPRAQALLSKWEHISNVHVCVCVHFSMTFNLVWHAICSQFKWPLWAYIEYSKITRNRPQYCTFIEAVSHNNTMSIFCRFCIVRAEWLNCVCI